MQFRVLGSVGAFANGRFAPIAGMQQRILLATLLIRAGRLVPSEQLQAELWSDHQPEQVTNALQAHVSRLRRTLRRLGAADPDEVPELRIHASGYVLDVAPEAIDMNVFRQQLSRARNTMAGDPPGARAILESALQLWQGSPLQDVSASPLCRSMALQLDEEYLVALESKLELGLKCNEPETVISELRRMSADHPWRERITELLMLALYRCGRQAEAVEAYTETRTRLADQLGIEPSPQLRELFHQILKQDPALAFEAQQLPQLQRAS
jgi:DNA-binding SARP family transcriptional activator